MINASSGIAGTGCPAAGWLSRTCRYMPGLSRCCGFCSFTRAWKVRVSGSTFGSSSSIVPLKRSPGQLALPALTASPTCTTPACACG